MKSVDGKKRCAKCKVWFDDLGAFNKNKSKPDGLTDECRECANVNHRKWSQNGGLKHMREHARKRWADGTRRDYWYRKTYGITLADYEKMESEQQGCCALCGWKPKRLVVDHCHKTGKVRGLLCISCNLILGRWGDDESVIEKLSKYLKPPKQPKPSKGLKLCQGTKPPHLKEV